MPRLYICARTLDASAIASRARSLADFMSSGRMRRLDIGRFFMAPVERGTIEAACFCFLLGGDCDGMGFFECWRRPVSTVSLDDGDRCACGLRVDGFGMLLVWRLMGLRCFLEGSW